DAGAGLKGEVGHGDGAAEIVDGPAGEQRQGAEAGVGDHGAVDGDVAGVVGPADADEAGRQVAQLVVADAQPRGPAAPGDGPRRRAGVAQGDDAGAGVDGVVDDHVVGVDGDVAAVAEDVGRAAGVAREDPAG